MSREVMEARFPVLPADREGTTCSFADPAFVVYSSVASFYVPFIVTLLVYAQICVVLRRRGRRMARPPRGGRGGGGGPEEPRRHRKVARGGGNASFLPVEV